jgi:hypothetical protein
MKNPTYSGNFLAGIAVIGLLMAIPALAQEGGAIQVHDAAPHDLYWLFNRYWWLIFVIFGMAIQSISTWQGHSRANRTIDIIKSYADQGKEPPSELLATLRDPNFTGRGRRLPSWGRVFLFGALAAGFVMFALLPGQWDDIKQIAGFYFVALIMAGLCIGNLVSLLSLKKRDGDSGQ